MPTRPFIDYRMWAEIYAHERGARLIFSDTLLRVETVGRLTRNELQEHIAMKRRLSLPRHISLIDMRGKSDDADLPALSEEVTRALTDAHARNKRVCILSARKGLAPATYCKDCGLMVTCDVCNAGLILHTGKKENFFLCHKCGKKTHADTTCVRCGSWHLRTFGMGIEKVEQAVKACIPSDHVIRLDKDVAGTTLKARDSVAAWKKNGTVLLATERALPFVDEADVSISLVCVAGIDALFTIPDFRMYERIFSLLAHVGGWTREALMIETRNPDHPLFKAIARNDLMSFYREELSLRRTLSYPPESVFIKISLSGNKETVVKEMQELSNALPHTERVVFPALVRHKGKYTMHTLIKIPYEKWPDEDISRTLRDLPPRFSVKVDPDSLLS